MVTSTDALRRTLERLRNERAFRQQHRMRVPKSLVEEIARIEEQLTPSPKAKALPMALRPTNWWLVGAAALLAATASLFFFF